MARVLAHKMGILLIIHGVTAPPASSQEHKNSHQGVSSRHQGKLKFLGRMVGVCKGLAGTCRDFLTFQFLLGREGLRR